MINCLTNKEVDDINFNIMYIDYKHTPESTSNNVNVSLTRRGFGEHTMSIEPYTKNITLTERKKENLYKYVCDYFNNLKYTDLPFSKDKKLESVEDIEKFLTACMYYIAAESRIKTPDYILMNNKMYDKFQQTGLNTYLYEKEINFGVFKDLKDDDIILIANTNIDQPGYKFLYHTDENDILYYDIVELGFFPDKSYIKVNL